MGKNIGFISTRFAGIDGVSLEAGKWAQVFEKNGHRCFWFAGELDRDPVKGHLVPEAHFQYQRNQWINSRVLYTDKRDSYTTEVVHSLRALLKEQLRRFIHRFDIDMLLVENALTIPMHIPLGIALTEVIAEIKIPTIAHHHDFYWERSRYSVNGINDYLQLAFPPKLPNIKHVVINSDAQEQLAMRAGVSSVVIPNVLDFEHPPTVDADRIRSFRASIGLNPNDKMILQPTRIIQRKGIEHAIDLVKALNDDRYKLVISHDSSDEGFEYVKWLTSYARDRQVDLRIVKTTITSPWHHRAKFQSEHSLWDVYASAELVTYPSVFEGFGNALLEAIYFKKPLLINRYPIFIRDIESKGFDLAVMDGFLSNETVQHVKGILGSSARRDEMVLLNYDIASRHYSYGILENQLNAMVDDMFGDPKENMSEKLSENQQNVIYLNLAPSPSHSDRSDKGQKRYASGIC